jgi:hypothetical protein
LYPARRQISGSVFTFGVSPPWWRSATTSVPKQSRPVSIDEYAGVVGMCAEYVRSNSVPCCANLSMCGVVRRG